MSPPQKKQNNNKKRDSSRSKQTKQSSSTSRTNESTTADDQAAALTTTPEIRKTVMVEEKSQIEFDLVMQNHQELFINKCLIENRQERDKDKNDSCEMVIRSAILKLRAELKDLRDLSNLPSFKKELENVVADTKKKIEKCETYGVALEQDYTTMMEYLTAKIIKINQTNAKTKELIQKSIDQQIYFDRESQKAEQEMEKLNRQIDERIKQRDEMALRLAEANKIYDQMTKAHTKIQKTNQQLKHQIDKKKREKGKSDEALAVMNNIAMKSINEKRETIKKLDEEEIQLKKEQATLLAGLSKNKEKYNLLCQKEDQLTKKTADQEKQIARVKTANKQLRDDKTAKLEFNQKYSQLSAQLKKIADDNAEKQKLVNLKQQQWDALQRVQETVVKKQRTSNELQLKVATLMKENSDSIKKISDAKKTINDLRLQEDQKGMAAISFVKRIRFSTTNTTADELEQMGASSDASSINPRHLESSDLDSDFDFNYFDAI